MNLQLQRINSEISALEQGLSRGIGLESPQFKAWLHGESWYDPVLAVTTTDAWKNDPIVRKCINVKARTIAGLPFLVGTQQKEGGEIDPIEGHWLSALMQTPNPIFTLNTMLAFTVAYMDIFGEAFWWVYRGAGERPTELWLVDPRHMQPVLDHTAGPWPVVAWNVYFGSRRFTTIMQQDLVHFRYENPLEPWRGAAPLESCGLAVSGNIEMSKYNVSYFKRGAKMAGVLYADDPRAVRNKDQADEIRSVFMSKYKDPHQVAVLWGGLKFQQLTGGQTDSMFLEGKKNNREEICVALGVPPVLVGLSDGATYANANIQEHVFWTITNVPLTRLLAAPITQTLLYREPRLRAGFDLSGVKALQDEYDTKSMTAQRWFTVGMPYNDIIELLRIPVKKQKWGNVSLISAMMTPAQALIDAMTGDPDAGEDFEDPAAPPPDDDEPPPPEEEDAQTNALMRPLRRTVDVRDGSAVEMSIAAFTARAQRALTAAGFIMRGEPVDELHVSADPAEGLPEPVCYCDEDPRKPHPAHVAGVGPQSARRAQHRDGQGLIEDVVLIIGKDADEITSFSHIYYDQFFELGGEQMGELLNISFEIDAYPEAARFLATKEIKVQEINATTQRNLRKTLDAGLAAGENMAQLTARVRKLRNFTVNRSDNIARTEGGSVVNGARNIVMKQEGIEKREWWTAGDEHVREDHETEGAQSLDEPVGIDEEFPVTHLMHPGDPNGDVRQIARCRCIEMPVLNDERGLRMRALVGSREFYWRAQSNSYRGIERQYSSRLRRFFKEQFAEVLALMAKATV